MARGKDIPEMFEAFRMQRGEQKTRKSGEEKPEQGKRKEPEAKPAVPERPVRKVEPPAPERAAKRPEPPAPEQPPRQTEPPTPRTQEAEPSGGYLRRRSPVWLRAVMDSDDAHFLPLGARAQVVLSLSYNALIVVIIVFVLFSVMIAFVGYVVGTRWPRLGGPRSTVQGEVRQPPASPGGATVPGGQPVRGGPPAVPGGAPTRGGTPPPPTRVQYVVKVLEVTNSPARQEAVDRDIDFLKRQRVEPVVKQVNPRTNTIAILAGSFEEGERDKAEQLMTRLRLMTVDGRREFKDAQVVSVP